MPLEMQTAVIALVARITGGNIGTGTPEWLKRPGMMECGEYWDLFCKIYKELTVRIGWMGLELPTVMPIREWRKIDGVLERGSDRRIIEVDESQHFNLYRGITLRRYPAGLVLAFDHKAWLERSQHEPKQRSGKWAAPKPPLFPGNGGRHLQRAFRDALADVLPLCHGFQPTLRVADFEVEPWIWTKHAPEQMDALLQTRLRVAV
jgi:hypothetical protein